MVDDGSKLRLCCAFPYFCLLVVLLFAAVTNGLPNGMARALFGGQLACFYYSIEFVGGKWTFRRRCHHSISVDFWFCGRATNERSK